MGKIVVGRWDCSYCGTKGIRGSERECPNCGRPRGEDVKFYVDDPKDYVPEDEATKISKEPDWMCEFCGSYNSAKLTKCKVLESCVPVTRLTLAIRLSTSFSYVLLRLTQRHRQLSSAPG